jgi:hypothetical protein
MCGCSSVLAEKCDFPGSSPDVQSVPVADAELSCPSARHRLPMLMIPSSRIQKKSAARSFFAREAQLPLHGHGEPVMDRSTSEYTIGSVSGTACPQESVHAHRSGHPPERTGSGDTGLHRLSC